MSENETALCALMGAGAEAHRLLKKVLEGEGNGNREKAVEFFCNMLAENRSFGQGT